MAFAQDCLDQIGVCINRLWSVSVGQYTDQMQSVQLIDPLTSQLINLTQYGIGPTSSSSSDSSSSSSDEPKHGVYVIAKAYYGQCTPTFNVKADIATEADAINGIIQIPFTSSMTCSAGMFLAQSQVWEAGVMRRFIPFYLEITPSLSAVGHPGPITMAEVRLAVRDVCPDMNFLIDTVDFKEEEILWAIRRPIEYFNEVPPPLRIYTPSTFPFRYFWMQGTIGELLVLVATWMRRNDLDYTAGGVSVGDTKKWPDYYKMGQDRQQEFKAWVRQKKMELNLSGAYNSMGGYIYTPYR